MTQRESRLSSRIIKALRHEGAFCFKVWGSEHMMAGLPDIIGCYHGHFFALEVKNPENRDGTSVRQEYVIRQIRVAGGIADVVCSPEEACKILKQAL